MTHGNPCGMAAAPKHQPATPLPHAEAVATAEALCANLGRVVAYLIANGISVISFVGAHKASGDLVVVNVAASRAVRQLLTDCAWRKRRQDGALTIHTWFAVRHGIRIEWEETCA